MRQMYLLASIVVSFLAASARTDPAVRGLPAGMGLLADHHDDGVRRVRARGAGRAADGRAAVRPRRPPAGAARRDRRPGRRHGGLRPRRRGAASCWSPGSCRACPPARPSPPSAPRCSTSTGRAAPSRTPSRPASARRPARCCPALVVQFLPAPTHLIYLVLLAVLRRPGGRRRADAGDGHAARPVRWHTLVPEIDAAARRPRSGARRRPGAVRGLGAGRVLRLARPGAGRAASPAPTRSVYGGLGLFVLAGVAAASVLRRYAPRRPAR